MYTSIKNHRRSFICLALLGFFSAFALPSVGNATAPGSTGATPATSAPDDDDCPPPKSTVVLEFDVTTGVTYVVADDGSLTPLLNHELDVYVGPYTKLLVDLQFSSGEWMVDVSASGGTTETVMTKGGALRYWMYTSYEEYVFSASQLSASAMMNMTPVEPDIVILPKKDCPPPP
jgi:hypothetical protein